jgi:cytochrome d ubiquinol oxidase subunit II
MEPTSLELFWAGVIAISILVYVILDGFDLGVGILFGTTGDEDFRHRMMSSIAPVWGSNETWLVVIGASLFAAFPAVYTVFLGAFYLPVLLMLFGLIFRGIAFEFRYRTESMRPFWDRGFFIGSIVVAFVQGAAIGAMLRGVAVENFQYAGGSFDWLMPLPVLTGIGLVFGYALLGAGWLVLKSEGDLRDWARRRVFTCAVAMLVVLVPATVVAMTVDFSDGLRELADRVDGWTYALLAAALCTWLGVLAASRGHRDWLPFTLSALFFLIAFATLGDLMWPYMIPYSLTVAQAAAPEASLQFLFYGGVFVLPIVGLYTIGVYWLFRGKARDHHY